MICRWTPIILYLSLFLNVQFPPSAPARKEQEGKSAQVTMSLPEAQWWGGLRGASCGDSDHRSESGAGRAPCSLLSSHLLSQWALLGLEGSAAL